jgi:dimethylaniline monooxygenase (N-oxide forming)
MKIKTIGIIGAGISGLVAAKTFIQAGYKVTIFEKQPSLGGVWEKSRTYPKLTTQNTRDTFCFSDYPMPQTFAEWPTAPQMRQYLQSYADDFGVTENIIFNSEVINISQASDNSLGWVVTVKNSAQNSNQAETTYKFDFILVCNGLFNLPKIPQIPGLAEFTAAGGQVIHSTEFNNLEQIQDKRVMVVGFGKSASDIACIAAENAKKCDLVFRHALWRLPKYFFGKINFKNILLTRFAESWLPYHQLHGGEKLLHTIGKPLVWAFWRANETVVRQQFKLDVCNMLPDVSLNDIDCSTGIAGDNFFEYVQQQKIIGHKTEITRYTSTGVELANGEQLATDIIIFGTGFRQNLPFLDTQHRQKLLDEQGYFHLYRHLIHPEIPNLAFVGYNTSFFSQLTSEASAWWLLDYIEGQIKLPQKTQMYAEIQADLDWIKTNLSNTNKASGACVTPFSLRYIDILLEDMGINPQKSLWKGIPRLMQPLDPTIYNEVRQEIQAKRRMEASLNLEQKTVLNK